MNRLIDEALDKARAIARLKGGSNALDRAAAKLTATLTDRATLPKILIITPGSRIEWRSSVVRRGEYTRRSLVKARQAQLRSAYPDAYAAAQRIVEPTNPYQVRLDTARSGKTSTEWAAIIAESDARLEQTYAAAMAGRDWGNAQVRTRALFDIRTTKTQRDEMEARRKDELAAFIIANDLPLRIPGASDGMLVIRENTPKTTFDLDLIESQYPEAAHLIARTTIPAAAPYIVFHEIKPDPDDDDEGDQEPFEGY